MGLSLKGESQIHILDKHSIRYIGTTIRRNKIVLAPKVFLKAKRAAARMRKKGYITLYDARKMLSYAGRFKRLDTRMAYLKYLECNVKHKKCRKIISKGDRKHVGKGSFERKTAKQ